MSRELAAVRGRDEMQAIAIRHVAETFTGRAAILLPDDARRIGQKAAMDPLQLDADASIAQWVLDHGRPAGLGADALPGAPAAYLPLTGSKGPLGVLAVLPENPRRVLLPEQRHLLETFAGQIALALERVALAEIADKARLSAETEALRNTLLASISHDLRTPLAVIAAASGTLADDTLAIDPESRRALVGSIGAKSREMEQLVSNVLDLMRFETGPVPLRLDWESLDDLVGLALQRLDGPLHDREVRIRIPDDLPLVRVDAALVVQLLTNLLDNVVRHAPHGRWVEISAAVDGDRVRVTVDDDGPGLPVGDVDRLFAKFQRGKAESDATGAGLGLAICRAIAEAHGGTIRAMSRPGGPGARFEFTLPTQEPGA
jgi:two-component system sensor histidine kinase KdpD